MNQRSCSNNVSAFFALVRAGLWEQEVMISTFGNIDFEKILNIAEEQATVGLLTAGLEHVHDVTIPNKIRLLLIGKSMQVEYRSSAMNHFISDLVLKMRCCEIDALLVKGQGVAQCYERPLWRTCGDVDFLLNEVDYRKAKQLLLPMASDAGKEYEYDQHQALTIDSWTVELHGTLRCGLSKKMDAILDGMQKDLFYHNDSRSWQNGKTSILLPGIDTDIVLIFTHFLKHFYMGGLGIRQICDWCRLIWTYREELNILKLEKRLHEMNLVAEWKAFSAFAVDYLGMPPEAMPLMENSKKWRRKARLIMNFVMMSGNFGHNRDMSYFRKYPYVIRKICSMNRRIVDLISHARIFPQSSLRFFPSIMFHGLRSATKGE